MQNLTSMNIRAVVCMDQMTITPVNVQPLWPLTVGVNRTKDQRGSRVCSVHNDRQEALFWGWGSYHF